VRATEGGGRSVECSVFIAANGWPTLIGEGGAAHTADDTLFTKGGKDCFFHLFILAFLSARLRRADAPFTNYLAASAALAFSAFIVAHRAPQCNPKNAPISSMGWREFPFFIFFATKERKKLGFPLFFAFFDFLAIFLQFFYERG
jgi:hypothetical protein